MERFTSRKVLACWCFLVLTLCFHGQTEAYNITFTCPESINTDNVNLLEIDNMTHPMNYEIKYYLYKISESGLTWCESYKVCERKGQRLAVLDTKDLQQKITALNMSDVSEMWIAGRRKDYGSAWTWINDTLTDLSDNFTVYDSNNKTKECVRITLTRTGKLETTADNCAFEKNILCVVSGRVTKIFKTLSWYKAMNLCLNKGGRLATWQDTTNIDRDGNSYWFGLHRRPWIWIDSDEVVHPVFYSSWSSTSGGDCMMLLANGSWMATQCNTRLQYIICEEHTPPTTKQSTYITTGLQDGGTSNNAYSRSSNILDSQETLIIALSVTGGVLIVIVLIGVAIAVARTKKTKKQFHHQDGVTNPAINEYSETHDNGTIMNPPESTAYKPEAGESTLSPYAEMRLPQSHLSTSGLDPAYALAKDPEHNPNDDKVIYSEVNKPKQGGTILFENSAYQPTNLHLPKQGPPKPKRQHQL